MSDAERARRIDDGVDHRRGRSDGAGLARTRPGRSEVGNDRNRQHTRHAQGCRDIDGHDVRMTTWRADETDMCHPKRFDVVDEAAGHEARLSESVDHLT